MAHVDLERYVGTWYEIASFPQRFQRGCTVTRATYAVRRDGDIDVLNSCRKGSPDGEEKSARGRARVVDRSTNARLEVSFFRPFRGDSRAAAAAGVERIVYLGGVAPGGPGSDHLRSRLDVGEALRSGPVKTVELRASMIVGHGSLSWLIVRDLAARLPVMILPRWLKSRTEPVAIDDAVVALVRALDMPLEASSWFDVPGPEMLSGKEILQATARARGLESRARSTFRSCRRDSPRCGCAS